MKAAPLFSFLSASFFGRRRQRKKRRRGGRVSPLRGRAAEAPFGKEWGNGPTTTMARRGRGAVNSRLPVSLFFFIFL